MNFAVIVAAGKGKRMGKNANKVLFPLLRKPVIYHAIKAFHDCSLVDKITIVAQKKDIGKIKEIKNHYNFFKIKNIVAGGKERQDSAYKGLMSIKNAKNNDIVVVHNGSNPLVNGDEIISCINAARRYGAAIAGFPLKDTIKSISDDFVEKTIPRKNVYQIQTPQAFRYSLLVEAFRSAREKNLKVSDESSLVEALGKRVKVIDCSYENIKVTREEDLRIAEGILMKRNNASLGFRMGFGHDSHRFSNENKKLVLGGCIIPNENGLEANSDGDVVLHALFNAISSAIGERSLGYYADEMCRKGVSDSREYLKVMLGKLKQKNLRINNAAIAIEANRPRLEPHSGKIKDSLSKMLKLGKQNIGITCTSGEGLTLFGQGKGIQCFVVVALN